MLNINESYLKSHKCYVGQNKPTYIVIHETDNWAKGAGAKAHASAHYNGNLGNASVHYYVDDKEIYKTLNHEDGPWAVGDGDGSSGITNRNSIDIEICVNPDSDYNTAYYNCVNLVNYLMSTTGIDKNNVVRHYDATGKWCPRRILDNNWWGDFKGRLNSNATNNKKGYVVTGYLPYAYSGYVGVDVHGILNKYFEGVNTYVLSNSKGIWIETEYLSIDKCNSLKASLGELFYSIE